MNIRLQTNTDNPSLELRNIERFRGSSGYRAELVVRSGAFSADQSFYFETQPLLEFIEALERMDRTLRGKALLKPLWEDYFVEMELGKLGHLYVRGELREFSDVPQSLKFGFKTDQTCLAPFIRSLKQCQEMSAT